MTFRISAILVLIALSALAVGSLAQSGSSSAEAYQAVQSEIQTVAEGIRSARSLEERDRLIQQIIDMLLEFRKEHPDTPESWDAAFDLALIKQQLQEYGESAEYLYEFILNANSAPKQKHGYAHFYLAEAFFGAGKLEDAEREYKIVRDEYGNDARLLQFANQRLESMEMERRLAIGSEPVSFSVKSTKGETLSPEKYKGKVLLLDFWATWCRPCIAEMPNVKRVYNKYKDKGFEIVGISLDRNRSDLDRYVKSNNIEWPQYFDGKYWQNEVAVQYGVRAIPSTFLIDRNGKIRYKSLKGKRLESAVAQLIEESGNS